MTLIQNEFLPNPEWIRANAAMSIVPDVATIWRLHAAHWPTIIEQYKTYLTPVEQLRVTKFRQDKDRDRFVGGRCLLWHVLLTYFNYDEKQIEIDLHPGGKPFLKGELGTSKQFSISHSGDYILLAVHLKPVGIDLELVSPIEHFDEVAAMVCSNDEHQYLASSKRGKLDAFFKLWVVKEAIVKALGVGMQEDLRSICALEGKHFIPNEYPEAPELFSVYNFFEISHYWGAIATTNRPKDILFIDIV